MHFWQKSYFIVAKRIRTRGVPHMINMAIIDNDPSSVARITQYLKQYGEISGEAVSISHFRNVDDILQHYRAEFDIFFTETDLPFMDGIAFAEHIRRLDSAVQIIFVTERAEYAVRGYDVGATDFLTKPVSYPTIARAVDKARRQMSHRGREVLIDVKGGVVRLDSRDIYYVESKGHSMVYHTTQGDIISSATMKDLQETLSPLGFFRSSKWYLINLAHTTSLVDGCATVGGERLNVSRARRKDLVQALESVTNIHC